MDLEPATCNTLGVLIVANERILSRKTARATEALRRARQHQTQAFFERGVLEAVTQMPQLLWNNALA